MTKEERVARRKVASWLQIFSAFLTIGFGAIGAVFLDWSKNQVVTVIAIGFALILLAGLVKTLVNLDQLYDDIDNWLKEFKKLPAGRKSWFVNSDKFDQQIFLNHLSKSNIPYFVNRRSKHTIEVLKREGGLEVW